ncbi:adipokinetic hormone 1 precursor [Bombyx mori]|uniref:Adipokinetic hormone-1 n=1 Tax=Bombyx mori TaxID=7091 RepID=A8WFD9_BOMMO|nr:adipokinetic hormone 1 precursor [Bombyx mori]ABW97444.1 adipokinetic prohormone precursor type II [Bombyx mori]BAG50369.1 adipokinetic hormone-1 [Bombyx mori]
MYKFTILFLVLACFIMAEAQLTFTSSWGGKRAAIAGTVSCRNDESLASIYKLIQNEAEKLLLCQKP